MDHMPFPRSSVSRIPRVPLVCEAFEPCEDFIGYAEQHALRCQVSSPLKSGPPTWLEEIGQANGPAHLEAFVQRWIYFGLLHELLAKFNLYDISEFIDSDEHGHILHTRMLRERLRDWTDIVQKLSDEGKTEFGLRVYRCLQLAIRSLFCLFQTTESVLQSNVMIAAIGVCEAVSGLAEASLLLPPSTPNWPSTGVLAASPEVRSAQMVKNGWCPSEVLLTQNAFTHSAWALVYLQHMRRQTFGIDHGQCTSEVCDVMQIDPITYQPRHIHHECGCELIGPSQVAVAACLDSGTFPLIKVHCNNTGECSLDVVPYTEGRSYVAISHVWVDGLGNPQAMELPQCQIARLYKLLADLRGRTFKWGKEKVPHTEERDLLLWCDSICCPTISAESRHIRESTVLGFPLEGGETTAAWRPSSDRERELKNKAISLLREVYSCATYVLVLDLEFEATLSTDTDPLERAFMLITSRWMRRLWTFQEGALAGKLLVQFADQSIDLREIYSELKAIRKSDPTRQHITRDAGFRCIELQMWLSEAIDEVTGVATLMSALCHRRVTVPSDEAICISVILDLDVQAVVQSHQDMRMAHVWWQISHSQQGIHPDVIYSPLPRLTMPAFRWAPATFQLPFSTLRSVVLSGGAEGAKATLTEAGLFVQKSGWRIEPRSKIWGLGSLLGIQEPPRPSVPIIDTRGNHFGIRLLLLSQGADFPLKDLVQSPGKTWCVIHDINDDTKRDSRGLLVYAERMSNGSMVHRSVAAVYLARIDESFERYKQIIETRNPKLRARSIIRIFQLWRFCDALFTVFASKLPALVNKLYLRIRQPLNRVVGSRIMRRLIATVRRHADEISRLPEMSDTLNRLSINNPSFVMGGVGSSLVGHGMIVTESFDSSCGWYID